MKNKLLLFTLMLLAMHAGAQDLIKLNQDIDDAVVNKNIKFLSDHYADDFVFNHGTGMIQSKKEWLDQVAKPIPKYISRLDDSVKVESHAKDINILFGKLTVQRQDKDKLAHYMLWYVRVYEKIKGRWQMISHKTMKEVDL